MINLPVPLRGIVPPVITPLVDRDALDQDAFERLLDHLITGGSSALFILGSTGEAPGLSHRLRKSVVDCAVEATGDRVPLLVGITDSCFVESLELAEHAARAGAAALVLAAPYYFPMSQSAFLGYLERLAAELPLPLYLYNMPKFTKMAIEPETVRAAAQIPLVYGLKDSSGDREYYRAVREAVKDRPDFSLLVGIEEILGEMVMEEGALGGVCGGANLCPRLYVDLYEAALGRDTATVMRLNQKVMAISAAVYNVGDPSSSYLRGLKWAVSLAGFGNGMMAEPYWMLREDEREQIRRSLEELGILPG